VVLSVTHKLYGVDNKTVSFQHFWTLCHLTVHLKWQLSQH